jgi:peptide/nickel transport system substrate-binding protein
MTNHPFLIDGLRSTALALALSAGLASVASAQELNILRMANNTELQILDPIATPSVITRAFGYMVWDTLISLDSNGVPRPQMLEAWEVSDDGMTYTFRLREGLLWSDGEPVTAADCIASIERWGARDAVGRQLIAATETMNVVDDKTFELHLAEPFGHVVEALGKPASLVPFMMPKRIASTSPSEIIQEIVGSGPFIFLEDEWRPGDRAVFARNDRYVPRDEPADGFAGGKVVHFDRVEFVSVPDASTRINALMMGDVDYLERVPADFIPMVEMNENVRLTSGAGGGEVLGLLTLNHTQPPFDNVLVRRALQIAVDQSEVVAAMGYSEAFVRPPCASIYMCGSPYETDAGGEDLLESHLERGRELLAEAGYDGEPVVVLHSTDSVLIDPVSNVAIEQMRRLGLNVEVRSSDWSTVAQRRTVREPISEGGWSVTPIVWTGFDMMDPLINPALGYNCAGTYPGWWCDERQVPVRAEYLQETDPERRRELAAEMQRLAHDHVNIILLGQVFGPAGYRANLTDVIDVGMPIAWNMRRTEN